MAKSPHALAARTAPEFTNNSLAQLSARYSSFRALRHRVTRRSLNCDKLAKLVRQRGEPFLGFPNWGISMGDDEVVMTGHSQLAITPRDRYLQAAQQELIRFEERENEFRKRVRKERAAELQLPVEREQDH